jgi:anti-sigma regulatory factor (Ser/Thr protein kinase)
MTTAAAGCRIEPSTTPRYPLTSHLELGARPTAVPCARMITKQAVREWELPDLVETAELLVSELVTNAIRASGGVPDPVIRLWLVSDRSNLVIRVWDGSGDLPVCQDAGPDSECGRGLLLAEALSKDWGVYRRGHGKVVWVLI